MKKSEEGKGESFGPSLQRSHHLFSFNRFNFGTRHFRESIRGNRGRDLRAALSKESRAKFEKRDVFGEETVEGGRASPGE